MLTSEFTDEYQDWLDGTPGKRQGVSWFDRPLSDIPHAPPVTVTRDQDVATVIDLMNAHHQTAVLVVEGERLLGIFTERDVLTRVVPRNLDAKRTCVGALMTESPHVLSESTLLSAALRTLALADYHHLPLVDVGGRPRAVVSLKTIVRCLLDIFPREIMNAPPERHSFPPAVEGA